MTTIDKPPGGLDKALKRQKALRLISERNQPGQDYPEGEEHFKAVAENRPETVIEELNGNDHNLIHRLKPEE